MRQLQPFHGGLDYNIRLFLWFQPDIDQGGGRSIILLLQNHPDDEDQSRDDADLNPEVSGPFPAFHLPFAFGRSTRTSQNSSGPLVRRRPRWARSAGGAEGSAILSIAFAASS
jgi:hypothetical protein